MSEVIMSICRTIGGDGVSSGSQALGSEGRGRDGLRGKVLARKKMGKKMKEILRDACELSVVPVLDSLNSMSLSTSTSSLMSPTLPSSLNSNKFKTTIAPCPSNSSISISTSSPTKLSLIQTKVQKCIEEIKVSSDFFLAISQILFISSSPFSL